MPVVSPAPETFTGGVQASLLPWGEYGSDWQQYTAALAAMFEEVFGIVWDQGSADEPETFQAGWSTLLDPTACPDQFLPFLGQFVGVFIAPGTDPELARSLITQEQGFNRGQGFAGVYTSTTIPAGGSMVQAAQRNLTGTQTLILRERTAASGSPDPYHVVVGFRPGECPNGSALRSAVEAVKPAGIQVTYVESSGWTWNEAVNTFAEDTSDWLTYFIVQP